MRKFLLFCFLSIWMAVSMCTASAYAQEGTSESCCFWLENEQPSRPENLYKMETAQIGETHYYTIHFTNNCNMPLDSRISLDWELLDPNGQPIDGNLYRYADLAFQIDVAGSSVTGEDGSWVGDNVRTGMGRTSVSDPRPSDFPGFVLNDPANNLGSQDGYFHLTPENQYDFLLLHFLMHASDNDLIRVKITWKAYGNYTLIAKLNERTGGTIHENFYLPSTNQNIYYGGKQSRFVREIARFTLETMTYGDDERTACSGDTIWAGRPAIPFVFNPVIPQPTVDTTFEVFYTTQRCFGTYVDSIVNTRFVVAPIPPVPVVSGDFTICGVGTTTLTASSEYTEQYNLNFNWYASEEDAEPLYVGAVYSPNLDTEDTTYNFYVRAVTPEGCKGDALLVSVKVNKQPRVTLAFEENYCPDGTTREIIATPANFYGPISYSWTGATGTGASAQVATTDDCGATYNFSVVITDETSECTATASGSFTQIDAVAPVINNKSREVSAKATVCGESLLPEYEGYDALLEAGFEITDNCSDSADDFTVEVVSTTELDPVDCKKVFVRTYALTDHCGNSVEFNDTVVVVDEIAPTFTTPEVVATLEPVYNGSCELLLPNNVNDWINSTFAPADNCSDVTITLSRTSGDVEEDIQPLSELTLEAGDVVVDGEVITVTFADACGNTSSTTFTIDAPEALQVEAIADQYVACFDEDLTFDLTATPANGTEPYTYAWSTSYEGATVINPDASTTEATPNYGDRWSRPVYVTQNITYTVVVTDANGCTATDTVNVIVNALPNVGNVPSSVAVCYDAAVVIELEDYINDESYNYTWKTHSLTYPSIPSISGEFDGNSAVLPADYTQQIVDVCEDAWSPAVCNLVSRVIVEVTDENTGCKNDRIVNIKVNRPITYTTTELTPAICGGETVTMAVNTTNDYTYRWYHTLNGNFYSNASSYTVTPPAGPDYAAPYYYTVDIIQTQNGIECKKSEDFVVTVNYIPTFQINQGVDTIALCEGEEVTLSADKEQYSYTWSTGATTQSIVVEATAAGTVEYTATAATVEGCTYAQSVVVNTLPLPVITAQPVAEDNSICTGNTTVLSVVAEGATQYQWQIFDGEDWANIDGADDTTYTTDSLYAFNEAVTYKYRVVIANDGESIYGTCQVVSEEVEVVANPAEIVTIVTEREAVCDNSEVVIEISEPNVDLAYQWQISDGENWTSLEGETGNSLVYSLTQTTQFRVLANNAVTNCSPISNVLTIDSIARPIAQLLLDGQDADLYFCFRDSIIPSQINCLNSDAFIGHDLKFDFIVPDRVEAPGTQQIIIKGVGDFYVGAFILDETTGCSSDTVWHWIYSKGYPEYTFAEVAQFCDGDVATMEIVPQEETYTYTWLSVNGDTLLNGLGAAVYTANVNGTQKFYTVVSAPHAEQDFSCSTIDSIEVTANPLPEFSVLGVDSVEYCNSNKLGRIYISDTNYSYKLNGNDVVLVGNYIEVAESGYYEVTAVNTETGCEYSIDSVRVGSTRVGFNVQLLIEGVDADYFVPCGTPLPDSLAVNVSYTKPADMECTYSLLTGTLQSPSNQQVIVAEHGVYTLGAYVTNTTSNCVSDTVYHQIIAVPTPNGEITPDASICFGDSITLTYEHDYYDYLDTTRFGWSDGSIISREPSVVVKPTTTTTYKLYVNNVVDNENCGAVKRVTVTVNQLPVADVAYSSSCPNAENTFAAVQVAGAAPFTYSWNEGEYITDSTFTTNNAVCGDTIMVALNVKDANGCVSNTIETEVVAVDSVAPEFRRISELTVYCGDENMNDKISAWLTAAEDSVSDNCAISTVSNNYNQEMLPANGCGDVRVTFYAADACGNIDSTDAYIRVSDTVKPVLTIEDVTISCTNDTAFAAAVNNWINTLEVQTCGDTSYTYNDASTVVENNCGTYRVTFSATNTCSVSNSIVATVTVEDTVLPVLDGEIVDRTIYVDGECNYDASSIENIIVTDNCAPKLEPKFSDDTLKNVYGADSLIIRTWTSDADCGENTAPSVEQRISIFDTIKPEFSANNSNLEILCDDTNRVAAVAYWLEAININATDNCGIHSITNDYNADNLPTGCDTLDVTFTATDNYGNSTIAVYTIKSIDNRDPEFAKIDTLDVDYCANDRDAKIAEWLQKVIPTDNCSGVAAIVNNYDVDSLPAIGCGEVEVTFTATDSCGNSSTTTGIINVTHTATPTVIAQNDTIECGSGLQDALNTWIAGFSATAGCGNSGVTLSVNTDQVKDSCGTYTAIITATDGCGVSDTTEVSVIINDSTKPEFVHNAHNDREITINEGCEYDSTALDTEVNGVITDNCTDGLVATYTDQVITNIYGADSVIIRTWTSEADCGGNSADPIIQKITIKDQNVPVFEQLKVDSICKGSEYTPDTNYVAGRISDNCAAVDFLRNHLTYDTTTTNNPDAVNDTTTITWTVIDNYGNSAQATQMVIHFAAPIVNISGKAEICEGATTELTPSVSNYSDVRYEWSENVEVVNNNVATVPAGAYTVTATTTLGCVGTASDTVANYQIPEASIELPQSICVGATLPISYYADMNGTWNFVVTGAIVDTLSATSDTGMVATTTVAAVGPVVNVAATFTYTDDNCELVVEEGTAVKVGSYPKLLIKQGETFADAVEDNDVVTSLDAPIKFYLHVVPSDPNCPPSEDLRVSIDYQFSKDGVVLDNSNPLTNYLDDPNVPDPFYVNFNTKKYGTGYFTYTKNEGVFHYPYIAASYAGATHNFDYFRYGYIVNREISVDISGFIASGEYDIDFQLVTHYHPGTTTPYGDAVPGYQDGVEVGGHQFYINPFDIDTLAVNTMSIVVNSTPSDPVAPNTFGESFNHSAEELTVAEREMTIYPNPTTSDYVNVAFKNVTGKTIVRVLNMNGKLVDQFEVNILDDEFIYRYALDRVAPGVYFINAVSNDATFTKKVIIQNK